MIIFFFTFVITGFTSLICIYMFWETAFCLLIVSVYCSLCGTSVGIHRWETTFTDSLYYFKKWCQETLDTFPASLRMFFFYVPSGRFDIGLSLKKKANGFPLNHEQLSGTLLCFSSIWGRTSLYFKFIMDSPILCLTYGRQVFFRISINVSIFMLFISSRLLPLSPLTANDSKYIMMHENWYGQKKCSFNVKND